MRSSEEIQRDIRLEDAQLARYPTLVEEAARVLITNRALATALLQLHTNHTRYAELCDFLDRKIAARVEEAAQFELKEPAEELEEEDTPSWTGELSACAGQTQKGKACTRPGTLEHAGQPFCSWHYPHPESYHERRQESERAWSEYWQRRREALDRYHELERTVSALSRMNWGLSGALRALGIPEPDVRSNQTSRPPADRTVYVDGLPFELTHSAATTNEHNVRRPSGSTFGLIQRVQDRGWAAYVFDPNTPGFHTSLGGFLAPSEEEAIRYVYLIDSFYRIRRRRELGWFGEAVRKLASIAGVLTTPQPLATLCGIAEVRSGWRVFRFSGREWHCVYSGDSEAEARWTFDLREDDRTPGRLLVDPAHQIADSHVDSRSLW